MMEYRRQTPQLCASAPVLHAQPHQTQTCQWPPGVYHPWPGSGIHSRPAGGYQCRRLRRCRKGFSDLPEAGRVPVFSPLFRGGEPRLSIHTICRGSARPAAALPLPHHCFRRLFSIGAAVGSRGSAACCTNHSVRKSMVVVLHAPRICFATGHPARRACSTASPRRSTCASKAAHRRRSTRIVSVARRFR